MYGCRRLSSESAPNPTRTANQRRREAHQDHRAGADGRRHVAERLHLPLEGGLGDSETAGHGDERPGQRARRIEEGRQAQGGVLPEAAEDDPERDALEGPGANRENRGQDQVRRANEGREAVVGLVQLGADSLEGAGQPLDQGDDGVRKAPARDDGEQDHHRRRAERGPHQAARQTNRPEGDEHHDTDHVRQSLGDDDRRGARDGHPLGLEEEHRLEHLADLARRDRQDEAAEERVQAIEAGDALDAEASEVKLPFEPAGEVAPEREAARGREGPPLEPGELTSELAHAAPHGEAPVDHDREQHRDHHAPEGGRAPLDRRDTHRDVPLFGVLVTAGMRFARRAVSAQPRPPTSAATATA